MQQFKQNYFELFDMPESFAVNLELLSEKYRTLQSEWHPDRFANAGEQKKLQAVQLSSYLNQAFETLKSPLARAGYLLTLKNCDIENVQQQDLGMELLMEQMRLREQMEALPDGEAALEELIVLKTEVVRKMQYCQQHFAALIESDALADAKKSYHELQFLGKLLKEIEISEEQRLDY